jgi:myo-inositol-1(or 4)-monophosphatase
MDVTERAARAAEIATDAGALALRFFSDQDKLRIEKKGHQDFVSQADREVEISVRAALAQSFPDDAILGEEHAPTPGTSGFTWVIDPIDGTTNFINGIPAWTVVLAGVRGSKTEVGVIHDPCHLETYVAARGKGATLNGRRLALSDTRKLSEGSTGVGYSNRTDSRNVARLVSALIAEGGVFYRNASGALSLAYVAAGRLLGYAEDHMNAWDCLAGQLLVAEAGGRVETQDAARMMAEGGRVIVATETVFPELLRLAESSFLD